MGLESLSEESLVLGFLSPLAGPADDRADRSGGLMKTVALEAGAASVIPPLCLL